MDSKQQEMTPLVSFIITNYHLPVNLLSKCIDSVLALSLRPYEREIIVVDDGSDLSPINDLVAYGDEIIYVRQKHSGVSIARNTGIQLARGCYLQFIDGDDYLIQSAYEHCLDIIRYSQEVDVVLFDFTRSEGQQEATYNDSEKMRGADYMRNHNIQGSVCSCLFRKAARGSLLFTPGIQYGEDEEFTPQLLLRADCICFTDAKAYFYRTHEASSTHQKDVSSKLQRLDDALTVLLHLNKTADTMPTDERVALQRRVAQLTMDYLYNTIMLTRSSEQLEARIAELRQYGLFPLPDRDYTKKYQWFRRMIDTRLGRKIMLNSLPLLKRER